LEAGCRSLGIPYVSVLDPVLSAFQAYLGTRSSGRIGAQHVLDAEYFRRIEALNFSLAHDDGQNFEAVDEADVVLVGVSRTSKTPTSIYMANRGVRTANFPLVPSCPIPSALLQAKKALVVGLVATPDRIVQIRQHRVLTMKSDELTDSYVDRATVTEEIAWSRKLCARQGWPVIDVSRRSIEETAAAVMALLAARKPH
jgi:regulator of PEP synthase PpsR (kinase-PPPase family)